VSDDVSVGAVVAGAERGWLASAAAADKRSGDEWHPESVGVDPFADPSGERTCDEVSGLGAVVIGSASLRVEGADDVVVVLFASSWFADARATRASRKWGGNSRPRASARLRIPAAARGLKKNLGWTWASKMSDNEDAAASLGHSEVLSVQDPPAGASPRSGNHTCARPSIGGNRHIGAHEGAQDRCEVQTVVGGQSPRHVLPDAPFDVEGVADAHVVPEQAGSLAVEPGALAGDGEVLARGAADEDIRSL
jgi:hypothetical protein